LLASESRRKTQWQRRVEKPFARKCSITPLGDFLREGAGRKNAPYRYCLPAKTEAWRQDPIHPDNLAAWFKARGAFPVDVRRNGRKAGEVAE
jgi:hypothetical protein